MGAKQTTVRTSYVKTTKTKTRKNSKGNGKSKKCPTCGRYL